MTILRLPAALGSPEEQSQDASESAASCFAPHLHHRSGF
jgi:hypothetical protein